MDPVIIVSGNWVKKNRYVFNADDKGCRVLHLDEKTTHDVLVKSVLDDYGLKEGSHQIQLSYMFSNKTLKTMAHDTPPVYVSNTRQLQCFLSLRKMDQLRLCVETKAKKDSEISRNDGLSEKKKRPRSYVSKVESTYENYSGGYDGFSYDYSGGIGMKSEEIRDDKYMERASKNKDEEDEEDEEDKEDEEDEEEDDEFNSRFDMFDDSDGVSSDDDNFSSYGESPTQEEDSPTLPPKKRPQNKNMAMNGSKGNSEVLRLEMSSLNLAVGQRYESKADLERRLKLLTVRDGFDFDVPVSNSETLIVKCWVDGCRWRVRASTRGESPAFYVRIYDSEHTCSVTERSNRSRQATPDILGELYRDFLGDIGPSVRPKSVGITINKHFGIKVITTLRLTYRYIAAGLLVGCG